MTMNKTEALKMLKSIFETKKYLNKMEKNIINEHNLTWEDLAVDGQKVQAVRAYQEEKKCSVTEAWNFITTYKD